MRRHDLSRDDRGLIRVIDAALENGARLAGRHLVCRPGCKDCCIGPFPITILDASRLRSGMRALARRSRADAAAVTAAAREAVARFSIDFPGNPATGWLGEDEAAVERFLERHARVPCPALRHDSGTCALYAHRPISCRTCGPPVRIGREDLPPCDLCFGEAAGEDIERCRVDVDPDGIEARVLATLRAGQDTDDPETLVAFALR